MGLGFTLGLTCIGIVREFLGSGAFFGMSFVPADYNISIFVLAGLTALQNKFKLPSATNGDAPKSQLVCGGDCMHCSGSACTSNHAVLEEKRKADEAAALAAKKAAAEKAAAAKAAAAKAAAEKAAEENKGQE